MNVKIRQAEPIVQASRPYMPFPANLALTKVVYKASPTERDSLDNVELRFRSTAVEQAPVSNQHQAAQDE